MKASKEAGHALVYKANPNFEVLHHHLLNCLEKTTVRTHTKLTETSHITHTDFSFTPGRNCMKLTGAGMSWLLGSATVTTHTEI